MLDVNVVLAAHRDDHPHHADVRPWFDGLLAAGERFTVPDVVWASFVRIATNRRIFTVPTPLGEAFDFLRAVVAQAGFVATVPGPRHLELFEALCGEGQATGDLVPDAYLSALALEQGAAVATLDRDFARFERVRTVRPT